MVVGEFYYIMSNKTSHLDYKIHLRKMLVLAFERETVSASEVYFVLGFLFPSLPVVKRT